MFVISVFVPQKMRTAGAESTGENVARFLINSLQITKP